MITYTRELDGIPGATTKVNCSNAGAALSNSIIKNSDGQVAYAILVTAEGNDVRFIFGGATLVQGAAGTGVGHILYDEQSIKITGADAIQTFKHANAVNGSAAYIQVTPFFESA